MSSLSLLFEDASEPVVLGEDREEALLDSLCAPLHAERVLTFGGLLALDAFLYTIVVLPLRVLHSIYLGFKLKWKNWAVLGLHDVLQLAIIAVSFHMLQGINTSRVYHNLRGQAGITIFVLYSTVEVCDKFLCSVGPEISACLASKKTMESPCRIIIYGLADLVYTVAHTFILMWQMVVINLASNSYSNALLSFMLTNQFAEIKGAVLKKVDRDSLFRLVCADITQRFQFAAILAVIVLRNVVESWDEVSWELLKRVAGPPLLIMGATILTDWLKLAYLMSFNSLPPRPVFESFTTMLGRDYAAGRERRSQTLEKQAGLATAPLAIVCVRMFPVWSKLGLAAFLLLAAVRACLSGWLHSVTKKLRKKKKKKKIM